jgi:hypothetical protein
MIANPNGVVTLLQAPDDSRNPVGVDDPLHTSQGSSFLATLGWMTQSRWDWPAESMFKKLGVLTSSFRALIFGPPFAADPAAVIPLGVAAG